ncbi:MAG: DEAD/DEAH box helicase [Methanosarcinales archaeon]|nr:MAG: DEAD/DEAH box helicase [Methanosarcinales archaeon]
MQVLHAIWDGGRLHLWAESSVLPLTVQPRRGRPPKKAKPKTHPFSLSGNVLRELITSIFRDAPSTTVTGTFLLPSTKKGPLPSPWLIRDEDCISVKPESFSAWNIETLAFAPHHALDLLLGLPARAPHGIAFGGTLGFLIEAAIFSLELIAREQFMPEIKGNTAVWKAVISGDDVERVQTLAEAMPPACRAFAPQDDNGSEAAAQSQSQSQPSAPSPRDLIMSFIDSTVDAFVRRSLESTSLLPPRRGRRPAVTPLPQQFLIALSSGDGVLDAPAKSLDAFSDEIGGWLSGLKPSAPDVLFRTCFRLDSPPERSDDLDGDEEGTGNGSGEEGMRKRHVNRDYDVWSVRFFLQATDDPSLLIPAETVWNTRSKTPTFLQRKFENPQEQLLADLGRASRVFPAIEASLEDARPVGFGMSTSQAYAFLRESAPLLEQNGFGVLLPPWWEKPSARIGVKLKVKSQAQEGGIGSGHFNVKSIMSYDWEVAIGDNTLSEEEFAHLAGLKLPLVQVRGEWVELRPEDIDSAINFFEKKERAREITLGEAMRLGLSLGDEGDETGADPQESGRGLPIVGIEAEGWLEEMLSRFSGAGDGGDGNGAKITQITPPKGFNGTLRPYQVKGISWLAYLSGFGFGACLADDMGLGKTVELIAFLLHVREKEAGQEKVLDLDLNIDPTLLICPMSVVGNWQREVERFAPHLRVMIHHGTDRLAGSDFADEVERNDLVISTYSLAHRDEEVLSQVNWQHIVLDEAQNIKNPGAKQTQAIKRLKAGQMIALTGTPVENRLSELWSIMEFLNSGYLGSARSFRTNFAIPIEKYRDKGRAEVLRRIIQPFVLRRMKTDPTIIQDLPEKMELKVYHNLTNEQASLYEAVVDEMLDKIDNSEGIERKGLVLSTLTRLKQICNHPALFLQDGSALPGRSGKLTRTEEMIDEVLAEGDKALIFTQFAGMGAMLRHHLQERFDCEVLFLHGGTSRKQRDEMVRRFQEDGGAPQLFVLSLKAGGFGLNLTAANHVFHFDRWWNPAVENQATDRAFRIGQERNVFVHKFVCIGTLEERIDQMLEDKKELADAIVGAGEAWLTELSTSELKDIFTLSRDAACGGTGDGAGSDL